LYTVQSYYTEDQQLMSKIINTSMLMDEYTNPGEDGCIDNQGDI